MALSWQPRLWRTDLMGPALLFLLGACIAGLVSLELQRSIDRSADAEFDRNVERAAQAVMRRFGLPLYGLSGARGVYAAHPQTGRAGFRAYVESRNLAVEFPGVRGFGFIERVERGAEQPFVAAERADGAPDFAIRRLAPQRHDDLYVIKLIEPAQHNAGAAGLDVGSEARRRAAIEQAIDTGLPTMTAPITLVQDARKTPGVLLYLPAYRGGLPSATPAQRREALRGVLYAPIVYAELLGGLGDGPGAHTQFRLIDPGAASPADTQVFDSAPSAAAGGAAAGAEAAQPAGRRTAIRPLSLPGRTLVLEVRATPAFDAAFASRMPWSVFGAGALGSALLAALLWLQATGRQRAEALARHMTADLDRLAKVAQHTSNVVIITDRALRITWVNEAFSRVYGYDSAQALGRTPGDLLGSSKSRPEAIEQLRHAAELGQGCRVEVVNRTQDGREIWVDTEVQPAFGARGELIGFVEIASDITESRLAVQEIAQQRQRLANIIGGTHAGTWEVDLSTGRGQINDLFASMLGHDLPGCLARLKHGIVGLVHPDERAAVTRLWEEHLAGHLPVFEAEFRLQHRDGHWVWVQSHGRVSVRDGQGLPLIIAGIHLDISRRKQVEAALRASQAFLDKTGRIAGIGGWELEVATQTLQWTDQTCRIHDLPPGHRPTLAEAVGYFAAEQRPLIEQAVQRCLDTAEGFDLEMPLITAQGRSIWVRALGAAELEEGRPVRLAGTFQDVTERRAMAAAQQRSAEVMSSVLESLPCGLSVFDADLQLVATNRQMRQLLDLPDSLFARSPLNFEDVIRFNALRGEYGPGDAEAQVQAIVDRARGNVVPHHFERVRPDGTPLEIRGAPLPGGGFVTTYTDISERRRAEAEAQRSAALLRGAIDAIDEAFVLYDPDDRLVFCNDKYRQIYRASADLIVPGARFEQIVRAGAERGQYAQAVGRVDEWVAERLAAHRAGNTSLVQRLDDGRSLRIVERAMPDGHIVGFRIDITELVQATESAQAASLAKSQFLANMSHEIRTPMNAILGMLTLLRRTELSACQADYAAKTEGAARALLGLLNDILDFSKVEVGRMVLDPHPFRIDSLLRDLSVVLSANVGDKPVELLFDIDAALPPTLVGDAMRLQQVLVNLGGNAIKFTAAGEVVLSVAVQQRSADEVQLRVAVRDTGIGIAPENQARIFSGFTQAEASTTRRFGGTGLGLAISQRLVAAMGGELRVDSVLGEGSCFHFIIRLPVAPDELVPALAGRPAALRALVVDDNAMAREVLQRMGQSMGWSVDLADSGEQALCAMQRAADDQRPYQAVFVDWQMPGLDGWETSRQIRARQLAGSTPLLVMVTAHGREMLSQRTAADQSMLDGFLVKPVTASMLLDAVVDAGAGRPTRRQPGLPGAGQARLAGLRLLLVEDNANNQQVARELLEDEGAAVQVAGNGQEAVDAVDAASAPFDAVLMDLQMPVMDGFTATRRIRRDLGQARLPIIAMTANAMASDRDACLAAGMNDHVGKPFDLHHLIQVLRQHVGGLPEAGAPAQAPGALQRAAPPPDSVLPLDRLSAAQAAGVDLPAALQRLGGHVGAYQRMLGRFIDELSAQPPPLQAAWERGGRAEAGRWLHTVRGGAGTLGAVALAREAGLAEKILVPRTTEPAGPGEVPQAGLGIDAGAASAVDRAQAALSAALPRLVALHQALTEPPAPQPAAQGVDDAAATRAALRGLAGLLQNADMAALDALAALQRDHAAVLGDRLAPLAASVLDLEFECALAHCQALTEECVS